MAGPGVYELYAVRYAFHERTQELNFLDPPDPHEVMPIDYYVWAAVSDELTVVIDTGFKAETAAARGRTFLRCPSAGLGEIGVDVAAVIDHSHDLAGFGAPNGAIGDHEHVLLLLHDDGDQRGQTLAEQRRRAGPLRLAVRRLPGTLQAGL